MGWSGHHMIDPTEIESRFSVEDGMAFMASVFTEPTDDDLEQIETIRSIMEALPAREADFVDLYYFRRKKQTEIAFIFGCSQPTVCYRLQRATARIQFLLQIPHVEESELLRDMEAFLTDPLDVKIMMLMWSTTCQSEAAKQLGITQGKVRHRFLRTLNRMRSFVEIPCRLEDLEDLEDELLHAVVPSDKMEVKFQMKGVRDRIKAALKWVPGPLRGDPERFDIYVRLFAFIYANLNILREVQRPSWETCVVRKIDQTPA